MTLVSRSLLFLCTLPFTGLGCVAAQQLGDPAATDGGSGGAATDAETGGESMGSSGIDDSIHDDCIELVWSCPNDGLVCLPEGLCVPCAELGESPASAEGGHCCGGLVQDAGGTMCLPGPNTDACLAQGDICGYSGTTQQCCDGSVCNPATDLCESDGSAGLEVCGDFTPPPIECPLEGDLGARLTPEKGFEYGDEESCTVQSLVAGSIVGLNCGDTFPVFSYETSPVLGFPVDVGADVIYTAVEPLDVNSDPSVAVRAPEGGLLFAYLDHQNFSREPAVDISPLSFSILGTGCQGFDAGAPGCVEGDSVVSARVLVSLEGGDEPLELGGGDTGEVTVDGVTYDVVIEQADRIVCWDDSCAGSKGGPRDNLRMLIVAR